MDKFIQIPQILRFHSRKGESAFASVFTVAPLKGKDQSCFHSHLLQVFSGPPGPREVLFRDPIEYGPETLCSPAMSPAVLIEQDAPDLDALVLKILFSL